MIAAINNTTKKIATTLPKGLFGFGIYTIILIAAAMSLPEVALTPGAQEFIMVVGSIAMWRYSWGLLHFVRSLIYMHIRFPKLRKLCDENVDKLMPSQIYLLVTSFRINSHTTMEVYKSIIREAIDCGVPTTIVASIVELGDEFMFKELFKNENPPEHVKLNLVRIPGTGKRDGLAHAFRAISRDMPPPDAVVAVIDGDTVLNKGLMKKTAPFFKMHKNLGALTTDEVCEVKGTKIMREWHNMRFAQRQLLMSSMSLSRKVLTLTGRLSIFRAEIICNPEFIKHVEADTLDHWRLGKFKFLTGDDKSSWYYVLKKKYDMIYVPDVTVHTVEHPPSDNFIKAATILMRRWFGNMLRTNGRALALGPHTTGLFTWWCIFDQRISMWTALSGPVFVTILCIKHSIAFAPIYAVWIGFTRWVMTIMLLFARPTVSWYYPFLIYFNQIYGSMIKTFVFFRLDVQSWTTQKTKLNRNLSTWQAFWVRASSLSMHALAIMVFISIVAWLSGYFEIPNTFLKIISNLI